MKPVFLSYRRTWKKEVEELADSCRLRGLQVFLDVSDPAGIAGPSQFDALRRLIREDSSGMLIHVTKDIVDSACIWEVEVPAALERADREPAFPLIPFFRNESPTRVRESMRPHGPRLAAASGVVAIPPAATAANDQATFLDRKRAEAACLLLQRLLDRDERSLEIFVQTRQIGPQSAAANLLLDWRLAYPDDVPSPAGCAAVQLAMTDLASVLGKTPARHLRIAGQAHLSAAVLLGGHFHRAAGFTLDVTQQRKIWASVGSVVDPGLQITQQQLDPSHRDISLVVGISRPETIPTAERAIGNFGVMLGGRIIVQPARGAARDAIPSAEYARGVIRKVTTALMRARAEWGAGPTHLFISAPFALAVLLGHELNGLGPIHVYEHHKLTDTYHKAFLL